MTEQNLRRPPVPDTELDEALASVVRRGRRRKAQRHAAVAGGLAVALMLGAVTVLWDRGDDNAVVQTVDDGKDTTTTLEPDLSGVTTSTTGLPAATTTTAQPAPPRPATALVAVEAEVERFGKHIVETQLVLLDGTTGKRKRVVAHIPGGVSAIELSPDGKAAYLVVDTCGVEPIKRVLLDGPEDQEAEFVTENAGHSPAVSPDGRYLAYIQVPYCESDGPPEPGVRVKDLVGGTDRWVARYDISFNFRGLSWSADGTQLAVTVEGFVEGEPGTIVRNESYIALLDPTKEQDAFRAPRVRSKSAGYGLLDPTFVHDGLFVIETPLNGTRAAARMIVVDPATGEVRRRVATGDPDREYRSTKTDRTGRHLMYLSRPAGDGPSKAELRVSSNGERTTVLARDVLSADW